MGEKQMITHDELQVILEAKKQEKEYIEVQILTPNGSWTAPMCGTCGRIIHHPNCPKWE